MVKVTIKNISLKNDTDQGVKMAKCKVCKVKFEARFFLQKTCVDPKCLAEWQRLDREDKADKIHNKKKKDLKDNDRKIRAPAAQKAFNAYIRERDKALPCISCNKFIVKDMPYGRYDCGHFKTVGGFPELRFLEINAHKQCKICNGGSGNFTRKDVTVSKEYRINLIKKIGVEKVEWIEGPHKAKKYTCAELKAIEVLYKQKLKDLL